jgi:hypothetical protein
MEEPSSHNLNNNKNENAHRFALSAIRGEILERERYIEKERKREKEKERKREKEKERKREIEREKVIVLGYYTRVVYYP